MYVVHQGTYGWQVLRVDGRQAALVAGAIDYEHAVRIAELLEHHGMVDCPLEEVETTP